MHTAPYFTAFALLAVVLSLGVVRMRAAHQVRFGDGGVQVLTHTMRAFGNFIEYAPLGLILLVVLELNQAPTWYLHICGMTLLIGRISHAIAFSNVNQRHVPFRVTGMVLTWISLLLSGIGIGVFALLNARV